MEDFLKITLFNEDNIETYINSKSYISFCEMADELSELTDNDLYLESNPIKSGVKIAGTVVQVKWTIITKTWALISGVLDFLDKTLSDLPATVGRVANNITNFPETVKKKIRGDIKIYIRATDIPDMYKSGLMSRLVQYMQSLQIVSSGDEWGVGLLLGRKKAKSRIAADNTVLTNVGLNTDKKLGNPAKVTVKDSKHMNIILNLENKIRLDKISPTMIRVDNPMNVETYFISQNCVKFRDLKGNDREVSYIEGLKILCEDLENCQKAITELRKFFSEKIDTTSEKESFEKLNDKIKKRISDILGGTAKVTGTISQIVKCVMADVNTINKASKKINDAVSNNA